MKLKNIIKYIFSSNYRYQLYKNRKDEELRKRMAENPENFHEDENWIWEMHWKNDSGGFFVTGKLKENSPSDPIIKA